MAPPLDPFPEQSADAIGIVLDCYSVNASFMPVESGA